MNPYSASSQQHRVPLGLVIAAGGVLRPRAPAEFAAHRLPFHADEYRGFLPGLIAWSGAETHAEALVGLKG